MGFIGEAENEMVGGGAMHSHIRAMSVSRVYQELLENNEGTENLEKVITDYESKFFLSRWCHRFVYSSSWENYEIAIARGNMTKLGIENFEPKKESVFGVLDELYRLKKEVKKKEIVSQTDS